MKTRVNLPANSSQRVLNNRQATRHFVFDWDGIAALILPGQLGHPRAGRRSQTADPPSSRRASRHRPGLADAMRHAVPDRRPTDTGPVVATVITTCRATINSHFSSGVPAMLQRLNASRPYRHHRYRQSRLGLSGHDHSGLRPRFRHPVVPMNATRSRIRRCWKELMAEFGILVKPRS